MIEFPRRNMGNENPNEMAFLLGGLLAGIVTYPVLRVLDLLAIKKARVEDTAKSEVRFTKTGTRLIPLK